MKCLGRLIVWLIGTATGVLDPGFDEYIERLSRELLDD